MKLNEVRKNKISTLYLAVSLFDRYLEKLSQLNRCAPDLDLLMVTCLFISAKVEEHTVPNGAQMLIDFEQNFSKMFKKPDLIKLESSVLLELEFNTRAVSPLDFLDRFKRLLGLDQTANDSQAAEHIADLCLDFNLYMLINASFLDYKPS